MPAHSLKIFTKHVGHNKAWVFIGCLSQKNSFSNDIQQCSTNWRKNEERLLQLINTNRHVGEHKVPNGFHFNDVNITSGQEWNRKLQK